jgi:hypothetical protein
LYVCDNLLVSCEFGFLSYYYSSVYLNYFLNVFKVFMKDEDLTVPSASMEGGGGGGPSSICSEDSKPKRKKAKGRNGNIYIGVTNRMEWFKLQEKFGFDNVNLFGNFVMNYMEKVHR